MELKVNAKRCVDCVFWCMDMDGEFEVCDNPDSPSHGKQTDASETCSEFEVFHG